MRAVMYYRATSRYYDTSTPYTIIGSQDFRCPLAETMIFGSIVCTGWMYSIVRRAKIENNEIYLPEESSLY
jgi:hypothetical protein